ncbi:MAG: heat shock protein HspQ [Kordiimonadaceae bacterium]|nr:heat shock protein HspQ [Kordiimonadaceae bacterium]
MIPHTPVIDKNAHFTIGQVVQHRVFAFRGVIFDVDPEFSNSEEWWESIPVEVRPEKGQPFYHIFAENEESSYEAYVSQQNLIPDTSDEPVNHPEVPEMFGELHEGKYELISLLPH